MDRFDEIWKNRFNEDDAPLNESWAEPDELVWEGIDAHLKKDSNKKGWIWIWGIIALLAIVIAIGFFTLSPDKSEEEKSLPISGEEIGEVSEEALSEETNKIIAPAVLSAPEDKKAETRKVNYTENQNSTRKINQRPQSYSQPKLMSAVSNFNIFSTVNSIRKEDSQKPVFERKSSSLGEALAQGVKNQLLSQNFDFSNISLGSDQNLIPDLPFVQSYLPIDFNLNLKNSNANAKIQPIQKSDRFFISLNAGVVYWKHRISDQYTDVLSPFDFNYTNNFGRQTSINAGLAIGKYFELNTGARLENIRVSSGHNSDIVYSHGNEIDAKNNYSLTLATPYGLSPADFVLNRSADIGGEDVNLKVDFHSEHQITNVQIPLSVRFYPFGKRRQLTGFVETGASFNFLTKITNEIESIDTHHSAIQFKDSGQAFTKPEITSQFYDLRFGGGLNYRLSNNSSLNFSYNFSRGLNPVFEQDNFNTVIDRQHISLGLMKTF